MTKNRYWQFMFLAGRDGEKCASCGTKDKELVIDHIDTNRQNDSPTNLRLLCRSCNRKNLIELRSIDSVSERKQIEVEGDSERMPPEMKVALDKEPEYVSWLYDNIDRAHGLTFWDCLYEGADRVGISPVTARRYLMKKLATTFKLGAGSRGHKRILWRDGQ